MNSVYEHLTRRRFCVLGAATLASASASSLALRASADGQTPERSGGTYLNPVLPGDHPDAGAIRVGADYFLTHSSFQYTPGLPIWHSRDLVQWTLVAHVLKRYAGDIWAPFLCEHQGYFYVYFPANGALHVSHARSPLGPWCDPIPLGIGGIDPSHVAAPDGRRYLHFAGGMMVELAADGLAVKGVPRKVFNAWPIPADWRVECECLEASKIFWKDGFYYLSVAEGGTAGPTTSHMVISARARNVDGPWDYSPFNPIIHTKDRSQRWWSQGHGRLVDSADGSWWILFHGYENGFRSLGRQTLLLPVEWSADGWFHVPSGITPDEPVQRPAGQTFPPSQPLSDDFTNSELKPHWQFWKGFGDGRFQTGEGRLILRAGGASLDATPILSFATGDHAYTVEAEVEVEPGCTAGLFLFYDPARACGLSLGLNGIEIRAVTGETYPLGIPARRATLRLVNDCQELDLYYKIPGADWKRIQGSMEVSGLNQNVLGGFLSLRPAIYARGSGYATFRSFVYTAPPPRA